MITHQGKSVHLQSEIKGLQNTFLSGYGGEWMLRRPQCYAQSKEDESDI